MPDQQLASESGQGGSEELAGFGLWHSLVLTPKTLPLQYPDNPSNDVIRIDI